MGLLNSQDKEIIKRALPKNSNKIIDVTIARLYIAYPDKTQWQYTGLSGAITLVDDLVGHTFFLKLIDIFGHRGIIWDQELYINFQYYQDRTFFHTFEIEDCYAGLLFVDIKEAEHFLKRVQKREKYASRATLQNKKAIALNKKLRAENAKKQPKQGPRGETMVVMDSQRKRYNYNEVEHIPVTKNKAPPPPPPSSSLTFSHNDIDTNEGDTDQYNDGFDEDAYYNDTDVQSSTLSVQPAVSGYSTVADTVSSTEQKEQASELSTHQKVKHNVPPLPANFQPASPLSNNNNITTTVPVPSTTNVSQLQPPSFSNQPFNNAPQQADNSFPFPIPQMNNINMNLHRPVPQLPNRTPSTNMNINSNINTARPVPAPPPRQNINIRGAPPPPPVRRGPAPPLPLHRNNNNMNNQRVSSNNGVPPPPPVRRGPAPPPPPARTRTQPTIPQPKTSFGQDTFTQQYNQQMPQVTFGQSASLSPQTEIPPHTTFNTALQPPVQPVSSSRPLNISSSMNYNNNNTAATAHSIPPRMNNNNNNTNLVHIAPPVPPLMSNNSNVNAPVAPPPPPMMNNNSTTTPPAPPPPPMMNNSGAPVAPPPPILATDNNNSGFVESTGDAGRDALLASIRGAGGIKSLRKVDKSQLDRPSVLLQEARGETVATSNTGNETVSSNMGAGGPPSLADALAAALNKRKNKVGVHEDDDAGDDW